MAKKLDPLLVEILSRYGENAEGALWDCHGTWVVYHKAIERIAAKAGIAFELPQIVEANTAAKTVAIAVVGHMGDRSEWSFGEAAPANNKNAYPYAMAEKRAKDRVVLKLVGLHGLAYSEEESDDFKPARREPGSNVGTGERQATPIPPRDFAPPPPDETYAPPPRKANGLPEVGWREDGSRTSFWLKKNGTFEELRTELYQDAVDCHSLPQLEKLRGIYRKMAREAKLNRRFMDGLAEEFGAIERRILESMDAAELAEVPLKDALEKSLSQHPIMAG